MFTGTPPRIRELSLVWLQNPSHLLWIATQPESELTLSSRCGTAAIPEFRLLCQIAFELISSPRPPKFPWSLWVMKDQDEYICQSQMRTELKQRDIERTSNHNSVLAGKTGNYDSKNWQCLPRSYLMIGRENQEPSDDSLKAHTIKALWNRVTQILSISLILVKANEAIIDQRLICLTLAAKPFLPIADASVENT